MECYKVKQIGPNHADHISYYKTKYLNEMLTKETVFAQPKYDGERMLMHFNQSEVYCTSRRISKKTNRYNELQDKLPCFSNITLPNGIGYTVLDGECYSDDWSAAVGILHSLPERAAELLKTTTIKFAVFDCLFFDGEDLRDKDYLYRLNVATQIVKYINNANIHVIDGYQVSTLEQIWTIRDNLIAKGFEGCVVKSLQRAYYDKAACLKAKKFETVDCVVIDYVQGTGKYANTVGALKVGYYEPSTNEFIAITNVNCGTDADRDMWRDNWSTLQYSVLEVKCQEITKKSLRHPVYVRLRKDKDYTMCTKDTIFKET